MRDHRQRLRAIHGLIDVGHVMRVPKIALELVYFAFANPFTGS